jgi:hypothetical protein
MTKGLPLVGRLLEDLGIESLIIVDDEWETASRPTREAVVGEVEAALQGEDSPERQGVVAALAGLGLEESGPWRELLQNRWDAGDEPAREALATQLVAQQGNASEHLPTIATWFGDDGPTLFQLTPERWNAEGKELLDEATGSIICLFDELLGAGRKGTVLLQAAMADKRAEDRFFFGLLTGTIERSSEETKTETLQREFSSDRVIAIAKDRIAEPAEFAARLRLVVQLTYHDGLRTIAKTAIDDAMGDTMKRLDALTVADFDRIVIETARREGTWEADELLRLVGLWERSERRTHMLAKRSEIEHLLARIRVARPLSASREPTSSRVRELRRLDLYATQGINEAYLPIELGDVFSLDGQEHVLLVQPCDMVVRKGVRARDPRVVPLTAIERTEGGPPAGPSDAFYHLEYYESSEGKQAYIDFRKIAFLPLSVLDLVSFRLDGETTIDPTTAPPVGAFASMQKRFEALAKAFKVVHADVAAAEDLMATEERAAAEKLAAAEKVAAAAKPARGQKAAAKAPAETEGARLRRLAWDPYRGDAALTLTPTRSGAELRFGLRRVGRMLPPHASTALTRFHQYRSRPAFEADFAREYPAASSEAVPVVPRARSGGAHSHRSRRWRSSVEGESR